jgi:putative ABC transport system permease protein
MTTLFGQPAAGLAWALATLLAAGLLVLAALALRHPILFRLGVRNIGRRKLQMLLITAGLMLSTMLISAALGVGDVIGGTIQAVAIGALGRVDEIAATYGHLPFALQRFDRASSTLASSPAIAGAMPEIALSGYLLSDLRSRQIATVTLIGVPPAIPPVFGPLHGPGSSLIGPSTLGPDDVLLNPKLAEALAPRPGDPLYLFHDGTRSTLHVRALVRAPGITGINPTAIMGLNALAALKGWPGQANAVVVANRGAADQSADNTDEAVTDLVTAFPDMDINPVKRNGVTTFARAQDIFTRVFLLFTLFAAGISVLLIMLVFMLLAAERRQEMGVNRALGMSRLHLVQSFLFEGIIYDLGAAALGVGVGLLIGNVLTAILSTQLTYLGEGTAGQVQPHSLALAYCLGALCTGLTITLAAWWIGNLTIVSALRGVSAEQVRGRGVAALRRIRRAAGQAVGALRRWRFSLTLRIMALDLPVAAAALGWRIVVGGLPLLALGLWLLQTGQAEMDPLTFAAGATCSILGATLALRSLLHLFRLPHRLADRVAVTPGGLALTAYWALPAAQFDAWGWPRFTDGIEVFFVAGLMMVVGAVLAGIYNIDLLLRPFLAAMGLVGRGATARAALAHALHHKGRSGLALAMFALVAFTLTVMGVIIGATARSFGDLNMAGNGFDLQGPTAFGALPHVDASMAGWPYLPRGTLAAAGSATLSPVGVIQLTAAHPSWTLYALNRVSDGFLRATTLHLATRAAGFDSDAAVWQALRTRPDLAVIDSGAVLTQQGTAAAPPPDMPSVYGGAPLFVLDGAHAEDSTMRATPVWLADPTAGRAVRLTIIGIVDSRAYATYGIITPERNIAGAGFPDGGDTTYYFKSSAGIDAHLAMHRVEAAYLPYGLQVGITAEQLDDALGPKQVLSAVLEGFVGLTLLMGVAALGLIAARAVVERRHTVGTMRALGYSRRMVGAAFLLEALFTSSMGVVIGGAMGLILSKNLFDSNFFEQYRTDLVFAIPWSVLASMAASALLATLIATSLPAWQASRIPPARALRYE